MPDPARLRDSTQITIRRETLRSDTLDDIRDRVTCEFTVTVVETDEYVRVIGSPVVIKDVSDFLTRQGVAVR